MSLNCSEFMLLSISTQRRRYSIVSLPPRPPSPLPLNGHSFYHVFHLNTYELPETQWAAVTTQLSEINDPPQIKRPYRFSAIC